MDSIISGQSKQPSAQRAVKTEIASFSARGVKRVLCSAQRQHNHERFIRFPSTGGACHRISTCAPIVDRPRPHTKRVHLCMYMCTRIYVQSSVYRGHLAQSDPYRQSRRGPAVAHARFAYYPRDVRFNLPHACLRITGMLARARARAGASAGAGLGLLFRPSIGIPIDRPANYTAYLSPTIVVGDSRQIFGLMIANYSFCGQLRGVIDQKC